MIFGHFLFITYDTVEHIPFKCQARGHRRQRRHATDTRSSIAGTRRSPTRRLGASLSRPAISVTFGERTAITALHHRTRPRRVQTPNARPLPRPSQPPPVSPSRLGRSRHAD